MTRLKAHDFSAKRNLKKFLLIGLLLFGIVFAIAANQIRFVNLMQPLQDWVFAIEDEYQKWFVQQNLNNPLVLLPLAFVGGLLASISPCILSLLPINLGYIGTREITSRRDAFTKAGLFVLGVTTTLSLLGMFSAFAVAIVMQFRGYINLAIGFIILIIGLNLLGLLRLPLPQTSFELPFNNPYSFGLTFAFVVSPCSSPVLIAVVTAAAATGSQIQGALTMICYSLGYTALIFFASLFTGLAKQTRLLLPYSSRLLWFGGIVLTFIGGYYLVNGIRWFVLVAT